jgi:hypothetical protein
MNRVLETKRKANGDVWELQDHGTWHSITKTFQKGVSTMNEYGGYNTQHLGSPKYVKQCWKNF